MRSSARSVFWGAYIGSGGAYMPIGVYTLPTPVMSAQTETEEEEEDGVTGIVDPLQAYATNKRLARRVRESGQDDIWTKTLCITY